jgi:TPR repeat protein
MHGCELLGTLYDHGMGVKKDVPRAVGLFSQACETSHGEVGCWLLAMHYLRGNGVEKNPRLARQTLLLACHAGDESACREGREPEGQPAP